jgi:hypothetical protein
LTKPIKEDTLLAQLRVLGLVAMPEVVRPRRKRKKEAAAAATAPAPVGADSEFGDTGSGALEG